MYITQTAQNCGTQFYISVFDRSIFSCSQGHFGKIVILTNKLTKNDNYTVFKTYLLDRFRSYSSYKKHMYDSKIQIKYIITIVI